MENEFKEYALKVMKSLNETGCDLSLEKIVNEIGYYIDNTYRVTGNQDCTVYNHSGTIAILSGASERSCEKVANALAYKLKTACEDDTNSLAIVGGVIGGALALVVVIILVLIYLKIRNKNKDENKDKNQQTENTSITYVFDTLSKGRELIDEPIEKIINNYVAP